MAKSSSIKRLASELKDNMKDPNPLYSIHPSPIFLEWDFTIFGPDETLYEGGLFAGKIIFTNDYPSKPPQVIFKNILHPNIYIDGKVCISILHEGNDIYGYEKDIERWLPSHGINTIMLSIISLLSEPNFDSPANIDASVLWKDNPKEYKMKIYKLVSLSQN
jgi:ubiquitin-conjugating enzyme E2 G1